MTELNPARARWLRAGLGALLVTTTVVTIAPASAAPARPGYCSEYAAESLERQEHPTGSGRRIVVIGDSYSLGVGLRNPAEGWVSRIPGRVQVFGFGGSGFSKNASPCGAQVSFARRAPEALRTDPDVVIIEGGLNDTDLSTADLLLGFQAIIALVHGLPTLVIGPTSSPGREVEARRVDTALKAATASAGLRYLSMIDETFIYLRPRMLHIDLAGHRAYGDRVRRALATITTDRPTPPATPTPSATPADPVAPVSAPSTRSSEDGRSSVAVVGAVIGATAVGVGGLGLLLSRRRRRRKH